MTIVKARISAASYAPNPVGRLPVKAAGRNEEPKPLISPFSGSRI